MAKTIPAILPIVAATVLHVATSTDPWQQIRQMGRGINVLYEDPIWTNPAEAHFKERDFAVIKAAGFRTLRVNLEAFAHMDAKNDLDPQWLKTLDWVVRSATKQGLNVILDEHDYEPCGLDAASCKTKLIAFWQEIARRYKDAPDAVLFELLNEPSGQLDANLWNRDLDALLKVVRQTNLNRNIIIGASSNDFRALHKLKLPAADRHIIVSIHYYDPFEFTHQGASWVAGGTPPTGVAWGTEAERQVILKNFDVAAAWSKAHDRPIFLGEFGAYEKGDMASRATYTAVVANAAEAHGWAWAYWQFEGSFQAYDIKSQTWVEPILTALVP
jgi:endoglucanase